METMPATSKEAERIKKKEALIRLIEEANQKQSSGEPDAQSEEYKLTPEQVEIILRLLEEENKPTMFLGESVPKKVKKEFFGEPVSYG